MASPTADWPSAFLVPDSGPGDVADEALLWLGRWVVALTVAIQRWGRDPVRRGRVLSAGRGRVRLAIPWYRPSLFDEALALALQLIPKWSASEADWSALAAEGLDGHFGNRWADIQADGLGPATLRFIDAALRRGMPFDVLPGFVQIGWGTKAERFDFTFTGQTSAVAIDAGEEQAENTSDAVRRRSARPPRRGRRRRRTCPARS